MDEIERNLREQEAIFNAETKRRQLEQIKNTTPAQEAPSPNPVDVRLQKLLQTAPTKIVNEFPTPTEDELKRLQRTAPTRIVKNRTPKQLSYDLKRCQGKSDRKKYKNRSKAAKSPWVKYVKEFARLNNISYGEALKQAGPYYRAAK